MEKKELELYIHIPFCVRKCNYCDFLSFPADEDTQRQYVKALCKEIFYYGAHCRDYVVSTVYIGAVSYTHLDVYKRQAHDWALTEEVKMCPLQVECKEVDTTDPWYKGEEFAKYHQTGKVYTVKNGKITAVISPEGWISYYNQKGELLTEEYWSCLLYTSRCV